MNMKINALVLSFLFLFSLPLYSSSSSSSNLSSPSSNTDINWWCKRTPHPRACRYYLSHHDLAPPRHHRDFYKLSVRVAFNLALHVQSHLKSLQPRCRKSQRTHKAVLDCWKLYDNTLLQLKRTLNTEPRQCTPIDAQTWLSAALTNLRTCKKGFSDLKASYRIILPIMRYNLADLISNSLAINRPKNLSSVLPASSAAAAEWTSVAKRHLLQASVRANFVVAKDGSSSYRTVQAAVNAANALRLRGSTRRIVIYVKTGVYNEIVTVASSLTDLTMIGDGMGKTIITGSRSVARGYTTFSSPTFSVFGDRFIATAMTFRNTYGPGSQAVALLSGSDQSVFYRCSIEGYQDTLCVYTQRQFYRECDIFGTIDFIFGNAAVVIQNSNIFVRKPNQGEANVITAQGRTDPNQNTGIVIQYSHIRPAPEFVPYQKTVMSFLGRPWMAYSRTVYLQNTIDSIIHPLGWLPYNGNFALDTLYYAEFKNTGPGSLTRYRVKWRGYHIIVRSSMVKKFTVSNFITGGAWLPAARVPYNLGIYN